ncbi:carbohydrate ABC transporter permease [Pseudogracilibacillus auburnensis]|uniref:carbohydrate ABC transporter permease n=1 Tax=Pseudogracilibacillus auburnensis TaxID=1494959 RepID=UPI001A9664EF|nr:carbohydrate ABC transporter permease [Pseudogracilibacillus auburnensis]MBO1004829.1 carbohydrate ABC transporter permease [Pseudogracilibacillus auburnensis]
MEVSEKTVNKTNKNKRLLEDVKARFKMLLLGKQGNDGFILRFVIYFLLITIGFVYLYPVLYILAQSMKSLDDLLDPTVVWIPKAFHLENYITAWKVLDFKRALTGSLFNSVLPAIAQTISCAIIGYGLARFRFPGKNLILVLMLITFIIPTQVVMIPLFMMFEKYNMLGTPLPFILPAMLGMGIRSALFILIYMQFFKGIPTSLEEAAQIDGASATKIFTKIVIPISVPAIVVVYLFSMVWHWNETYTASLYLGNSMTTLPIRLQIFHDSFSKMITSNEIQQGANINESINMAGTMLVIMPLLILYFFAQRWFVEATDKTGIAGE